jgi:DMSO/TMAO reductase YedYZ molybdopterin-dependent catalytic subunit
VLVAATLFELSTGVANIAQWYPFGFFFPAAHYAVAWAMIGALLVHLAVKAPVIRAALRERLAEPAEQGLSRRGLLLATGAAVVTLTAVTVGQTLPGLRRLTLLAPRRPDIGVQDFPVNKTAVGAGVQTTASAPDWRLTVDGPSALSLSLGDLVALPQHEAELAIACVEGWSASARWGGVRLADLLDRAGIDPEASVRVISLQQGGLYGSSVLTAAQARHDDTLLALRLRDETLALDHGYPVRLIAPNRPGVLQTKWLSRIEAV